MVHRLTADFAGTTVDCSNSPSVRLPSHSQFEVRFGANATSQKMTTPPPSGMIQVNLTNENTRVVMMHTSGNSIGGGRP